MILPQTLRYSQLSGRKPPSGKTFQKLPPPNSTSSAVPERPARARSSRGTRSTLLMKSNFEPCRTAFEHAERHADEIAQEKPGEPEEDRDRETAT